MYRYIVIIGILFSLKSYSQSLDISKNWLINIGDTLTWANSSFNDSHWKTMENIGPFEYGGFPNFQNFGWLRKKVVISSSLKDSADKYGYFYLSLGKINDADQTFFNGKLVGQTGSMPPDSIGVDRGQRIYKLDAKDILVGRDNQIAIRIFSNFHNGGLWGENFKIIFPSESIFHTAKGSIPGFPLPKRQQSYEVSTKVDLSYKEKALKSGGLTLKLNLPDQSTVFYNGKYIGKTGYTGEHSYFVPTPFILWGNSDKIMVYLNLHNSLERILFSTPAFDTIRGNGFNLMQVSNFTIKQGSFDSNSPIIVSVKAFNTTNMVFEGNLTVNLTTDINQIQQSSSHPLRLNKMESKEIEFKLLCNFSGVYQVNYILRNNETGQKITGTLAKGERL